MRCFQMIILFTAVFCLESFARAEDPSIEEFLRQFHSNPEKMMNLLPPQVVDGKIVDRGFINAELLDRRLIEEKAQRRQSIMQRSLFTLDPLSAMAEDDNPKAMVDNGMVNANILDLDRRGMITHSLPVMLWSDTWWPIALGLLGNRYADGGNPHSKDWNANYAYYLAVPTFAMATDLLSPAEKYDLLVGDSNMSLTTYSWNRGRSILASYGVVPYWMGICHGWSGAAHMQAKIPYGSIVLKSANGTPIRFYQSDVKALNSLLWATADVPTRFLGNRCDKSPPRDGQGRTVDDKCRDNNPGSFFLTLTNQLGLNNRSFVMDATFDAEVWNYSVISYHGTYFNPQNFKQTDNVRSAIVPVSQFTMDKFRKYRTPITAYVVGVAMDVTYLNEVSPSHGVQVKPGSKTQRYYYDLELDANYNVIGGEWYSRAHPDFIWTFAKDAQAKAIGDADIDPDDWDVHQSVPRGWAEAARKSSVKGVPLYSVIKKIVEAAPSTPPTGNSSNENGDSLDDSSTGGNHMGGDQ